MGFGPATIFSGTTAPTRKERPGPDKWITRTAIYVGILLLLPVAAAVALVYLMLFQYARIPWWVPAPVTAVLFLLLSATGGVGYHFTGHVTMLGNLVAGVTSEEGFGAWWAANWWDFFAGQFLFGVFFGSLWAMIFMAWKWFRRPHWEHRTLRPGPVLLRRAKKTVEEIAAGENPPRDGVTVGVSRDLRDPRFAGGTPGCRYGDRVVLTDREGAGHCLVVGGSGSGKTSTMLMGMRDVIQRGHGLVVVDCKGGPDVPRQVADWAEEYGRDFYHWEMFDPRGGYDGPAEGPAFYNPIGRGDPSRRKDLIIGSQANAWQGAAEYYKSVIGDYLQTAFTVMDLVPAPEGVDTFKDVSEMLNPAALIARASSIPKDRYPDLAAALQHVGELGDRERSAISNMYARLNTLTSSIAGAWLRYDPSGQRDIDLVSLADRGAVVVFSLDSSNYEETTALLAGLIVQDLKTASSALREVPAATPTHVYIDEFSAVDATNVYGLLAKARDARMPVTLATQALADLKRREEHFVDQVLGIVSSFIIHRANSEDDARVFAGLAGIHRRMVHRAATEGTTGTLGSLGAAAATGVGYLQEEEDYRVEPGVFQRLKQGECVFIAKMPEDRYVSPVQVVLENHSAAMRHAAPAQPSYSVRPPEKAALRETFPYPGGGVRSSAPTPVAEVESVREEAWPPTPPTVVPVVEPSTPVDRVPPPRRAPGREAGAPVPVLPPAGASVPAPPAPPPARPTRPARPSGAPMLPEQKSDDWGTV